MTQNKIYFDYPVMPDFLDEIRILNLKVGKATIDLAARRDDHDASVHVLKREGYIDIISVK